MTKFAGAELVTTTIRPLPSRAEALAVLPHDAWCKAGGSDHRGCCREEITMCGCVASESLSALVAAGLIEMAS